MPRYRTGKRKKQRTKMVVPVRVRIAGANSSFLPAHTLDATEGGAKLAGIRIDMKIGDIVEVQHRHERAMFRVIWMKSVGGSSEKQIGIECVDDKNIWGTEFPHKPDEYEERGAKEALRLYRKNRGFDFVLCGLTLDGKTSGVQFMQRIHTINPKQAYGFVTGHPVLTQPFGAAELLTFIERGADGKGGSLKRS